MSSSNINPPIKPNQGWNVGAANNDERPVAVEVMRYPSIADVPAANVFGIGVVQVTDTGYIYTSNGISWSGGGNLETDINGPLPDPLLDLIPNSASAVTAAGFAFNGTGFSYDDRKGIKCAAGSIDFLIPTPWKTQMAAAGSIYLEVERAGIAIDDSQSPVFLQSIGNIPGSARYFMNLDNSGTDELRLFLEVNGSFGGLVKTGGVTTNFGNAINSNASNKLENSDFLRILITWSGTTFIIMYDGIPVLNATLTNPMNALVLNRIRLGSRGGATQPSNYFIRRIQLSNKFINPTLEAAKIAIFGDSFTQAFANDTDFTSLGAYVTSVVTNGAMSNRCGFLHLLKFYWQAKNKLLTFYGKDTTEQGHGYCTAVGANPFSTITKTAVATINPDYLICLGSVNDISGGAPYANVLVDTKAVLDALIDNSPNLKKILFFECFPAHANLSTSNANYINNYETYISQQSGIDGYRGIVKYIQTYEEFGGRNYNPELTNGSAAGVDVLPGNDVHPSTLGHIRMAEIIYPHLNKLMDRIL